MKAISSILHGKDIIKSKACENAMLVTGFVIMTALGAYIRIPLAFTPVPITLQTFFVILSGAILGRRLGLFAQASYVMLGVLGLPIFQGYNAGVFYLAGPTGGYLLGFIAAAYVTGFLARKNVVLAMSAGLFTIYALGVLWLAVGFGTGFKSAVLLGFVPFIPGAFLKLVMASLVYAKIKKIKS